MTTTTGLTGLGAGLIPAPDELSRQQVVNMDIHVRRIERELSDARSRLDDSAAEVGYLEQQSVQQRQQLLALSRALSESTQAAADVMANIQLSAYRARERIAEERPRIVQYNGLAESVASVVDSLAFEIDQQCERLNECTSSIQAQLAQQQVASSVVDVSQAEQAPPSAVRGAAALSMSASTRPIPAATPSLSARRPSGLSRTGLGQSRTGEAGGALDAVRLLRSELIDVRQRAAAEQARARESHEAALGTLACTLKADLQVCACVCMRLRACLDW